MLRTRGQSSTSIPTVEVISSPGDKKSGARVIGKDDDHVAGGKYGDTIETLL